MVVAQCYKLLTVQDTTSLPMTKIFYGGMRLHVLMQVVTVIARLCQRKTYVVVRLCIAMPVAIPSPSPLV